MKNKPRRIGPYCWRLIPPGKRGLDREAVLQLGRWRFYLWRHRPRKCVIPDVEGA